MDMDMDMDMNEYRRAARPRRDAAARQTMLDLHVQVVAVSSVHPKARLIRVPQIGRMVAAIFVVFLGVVVARAVEVAEARFEATVDRRLRDNRVPSMPLPRIVRIVTCKRHLVGNRFLESTQASAGYTETGTVRRM